MSWMQEAVREWAFNFGHDHPDRAWLLSAAGQPTREARSAGAALLGEDET